MVTGGTIGSGSQLFAGTVTLNVTTAFIGATYITDSTEYVPPDYPTDSGNSFGDPYPSAQGGNYTDPTFGTIVHRVSDVLAVGGGFFTEGPHYATNNHYMAGEERMWGQREGDGFWSLVVRETTPPFDVVRVSSEPGAETSASFIPHPTDPDLLYHLSAFLELRVYDISTDVSTLLHDFSEDNANYSLAKAQGEFHSDLSGNLVAFWTLNQSFNDMDIILFDIAADEIAGIVAAPAAGLDSVWPIPSGDGVVANVFGEGWDVYELSGSNLVYARTLSEGGGHSDIARGPDGNDYWFVNESTVDNGVYRVRIDTGDTIQIFDPGYGSAPPLIGMHVNADAVQSTGWLTLTLYTDGDFSPSSAWDPFAGEVIQVYYDGSKHRRLAHMRSGHFGTSGIGSYFGSTSMGNASPSGRFVTWRGNFLRQLTDGPINEEYSDWYLLDLNDQGTTELFAATASPQAGIVSANIASGSGLTAPGVNIQPVSGATIASGSALAAPTVMAGVIGASIASGSALLTPVITDPAAVRPPRSTSAMGQGAAAI